MYYRNCCGYVYPEHSDEHMIEVKHLRDTNFDENYSFYDKSARYKFIRGCYWFLVNAICFPLLCITHGLRIHGRKNLKKHKEELKGGAITICNHVFMWDYLCVLKAIRPHLPFFPAWKTNFEGPNGNLIRMSGGIPVPTDSFRAMHKFNVAMEEVIEDGKWLHVFPEGSMWFYYPDIRPLKKQVFRYAVKYNKPVIPLTISFRPRKGITKLFTKKPQVDIHIGEPMWADQSLLPFEAEKKMHTEAYHIMQVMNGINPGDPTYNTDQVISHYQKTM